jgi:hypothetical protein
MPHPVRRLLAALAVVLVVAGPAVVVGGVVSGVAVAQEHRVPGAAAGAVAWRRDVAAALEAAKTSKRLVLVCINMARVDGEKEEPAAKGLREVVYRDPRVVEKSREFECVLLTKDEGATDYDPLRKLGIEGRIISPQHVFIAPDGSRIVLRREYWPHGSGEKAVEALLALMREAQTDPGKAAAAAEQGPAPPEDPAARAQWIADRVREVGGTEFERDRALAQLVKHDRDGDCARALVDLLPQMGANVPALRAVVRALGRDGLAVAALPVSELLRHDDATIRANAAVTLEYIGSRDKKVVAALAKFVAKEKDEQVANHGWRALGRCGAGDAKTRAMLVDQASGAKTEFGSYGACIGLAYFEGDEKAMRDVEKILRSIGPPGGRRGGGADAVKRGVVSWTLASIGDAKSATFVRDELMTPIESVRAFWVEGLHTFWKTVAACCDGDRKRLPEVEAGVQAIYGFAKNAAAPDPKAPPPGVLMDEARRKRDGGTFKPKGDGLLGDSN